MASPVDCSKDVFLTVLVSSVDHSSGTKGRYFNFELSAASDALGRPLGDGEVLHVSQRRHGTVIWSGAVRVWTRSNGGSTGNSHGRRDADPMDGQWESCDTFDVQAMPCSIGQGVGRLLVCPFGHGRGSSTATIVLSLDEVSHTAASLELPDLSGRLGAGGFDANEGGALATEGLLFGGGVKFIDAPPLIPGAAFTVLVECVESVLRVQVDGKLAVQVRIGTAALGRIALRPHRGRIRVHKWQMGGDLISLSPPPGELSVRQANVPLLLNRRYNVVLHFVISGPGVLEGIQLQTDSAFCYLQLARSINVNCDRPCEDLMKDFIGLSQQNTSQSEGVQEFRCSPITLGPGLHGFSLVGGMGTSTSMDSTVGCSLLSAYFNRQMVDVPVERADVIPRGLRPAMRLRHSGDDGSNGYRIPGLVRTQSGVLVACYDIRRESNRDLQGDIDIGISRSVDGGRSWEPMRIALTMGEWGGLGKRYNGVSDACLVADDMTGRVFVFGCWMHGLRNSSGGFRADLRPNSEDWAHQWHKGRVGSGPGIEPQETAQFLMSFSNDDGATWCSPINLTKKLKDPQWYLLAPAPGCGITTKTGKLVVPVQGRDVNEQPFSTIMTSSDHGETWILAPTFARTGTNECAVAELSDGRLILNMKNCTTRDRRLVSVTADSGNSWIVHQSDGTLPEPSCMASLLRVERTNGSSVLLFANPACTHSRKHLTIKASVDDGVTWPQRYWVELDDTKGAYSCMARAGADCTGILYESSQGLLVFQRIHDTDLGIHV
ncbi:unnamed protein product [Prorocentrum cordatum]|uniref:Sialidase domain-containing protein n=1 Tax=Prorocentrum cordatum TaxID=2364126 RepID=A0ABN9PTX0_9DINO|nr:unnamed protein product [Polarella glacialis]